MSDPNSAGKKRMIYEVTNSSILFVILNWKPLPVGELNNEKADCKPANNVCERAELGVEAINLIITSYPEWRAFSSIASTLAWSVELNGFTSLSWSEPVGGRHKASRIWPK